MENMMAMLCTLLMLLPSWPALVDAPADMWISILRLQRNGLSSAAP